MRKLFLFFVAASFFAACEDDNGDVPKDTIEVTSGSTTQTIYADQTSAGEGQGITFTTSGPWTSEVREITDGRSRSQLDWVMLSQTSGDAAGEYTLTITLGVNQTGKDRKAEIRIICGESVITIIVEQKGTTEAGKPLRFVTSVEYVPNYCEAEMYRYDSERDYIFKYDQLGRIAELTEDITDNDGRAHRFVTAFDYGIAGEIRVALTESHDGGDVWTDNCSLLLDDAGRVEQISLDPSNYNYSTYFLEYLDGRLSRVSWDDRDENHTDYTYSDGVLSSIMEYEWGYRQDSTKHIEEGFSEYSNDLLNIDPNAFFIVLGEAYELNEGDGDSFGLLDRLALFNLVGKRSDRLVGKNDRGSYDLASRVEGYPTPGKTIKKTVTYTRSELDENLVYTFDEDGYVQTITQTEKVTKIKESYKIYVTDEVLYPDNPSEMYRGEEIPGSRHTIEETSGENRYVHTFHYE